MVKRIDYDSFGNIIADTDLLFDMPFGFAGGLHDRDTGLVRFGYRDYDPDISRWTAKDPILFAGGDTDLYGYVLNDPVNWVDPTGEFLVSGLTLLGYVYGPSIVAAGTVALYRLAPYTPIIGDFLQGLLIPGPPPPTPAGLAGWNTKRFLVDPILDELNRRKENKPLDNNCR